MTKVLIFGTTGMLGHKLYQVLAPVFDVTGTIRGSYRDVSKYGIFNQSSIVPGVDAFDISRVEKAIEETTPDVLINCAGTVKSLVEREGILSTIWLNALFPHQLDQICQTRGIRLIHISTDCVFSGNEGNYREDDPSDAEDIYGKTKYLGEVRNSGALTIRTSFIGRELAGSYGLLEWFLSNRGGEVPGYTNAVFNGFPTLHLSRIIADIIKYHQQFSGIYHISSEPINKFKLLTLINKAMGLNIMIKEYPGYHVDRSLDSSLYREKTGFTPSSWEQMVQELAGDAMQHLNWR
ncbi:dTDP-4-dehydrorhamnose reductase family protein [Chloroflexota bacterium]